MAIRFLHFVRRYLRCALVILALVFPGLAHAVTYVNPETQGYYRGLDKQWYRRDGTGQQYTINTTAKTINTTSKVHTGVKVLNLPSTIPYSAAKAGAQIVKLARFATPATIALSLLDYVSQNSISDPSIPTIIDCDGQWATECESNGQPSDYLWVHAETGVKSASATQACHSRWGSTLHGYPVVATCDHHTASKSCDEVTISSCAKDGGSYTSQVGMGGGPSLRVDKQTNPCVAPQVWNSATQLCEDPLQVVTPPTTSEWEQLEQKPDKTEPTQQQVDDLIKTPEGLPVETPPEVDGLPSTHPVGEPYQTPTGGYEQPVSHLTPGPDGKVGVENEVIPLTGPEGIDDPLGQQDPNGETKPITNTATSTETVEVDVKICEEGDDNLACIPVGTPDETPLENEDFELDFDHAPIAFTSGACPAGPQFATPWGNQEFDMYWPCEFATSIKPIILAVGAFAAMAIFVGGLRTS